jgi:hypothetical protein
MIRIVKADPMGMIATVSRDIQAPHLVNVSGLNPPAAADISSH